MEPALAGKYDYANEQNTDIAAVMRLLEVVSTVMAEVKALEGTNKSTSWELSSAQKQAEEADKNLMYARQRMRDVKASEAEARTKVTIATKSAVALPMKRTLPSALLTVCKGCRVVKFLLKLN